MKQLLTIIIMMFSMSAQSKVTITGTVSGKDGLPVSKCDVFFNAKAWIDEDSVHVTCDKNGRYQAEIEPGLYNSMYVCDEDLYGKTKLEFWGWNLTLEQSQVIDAQFDTMEVYSLSVWASNGGSNSIFASFRPMNLAKALNVSSNYKQIMHNGEQIAVIDIAPKLTSDTVKGFIGEQPLELISYSWAMEKVGSCGNAPEGISTENGCYMPMIIAQFNKPKLKAGRHIVKIDITDSETGDFGQGITHIVANERGLGF